MTLDFDLTRGLVVWTVSLGFLAAVVARPPRWLGSARFTLAALVGVVAWELAAMIAAAWRFTLTQLSDRDARWYVVLMLGLAAVAAHLTYERVVHAR